MIEVVHRVNSIKELKKIPGHFGIEIDVRSNNHKLVLSHDLNDDEESFSDFIKIYNHSLLVVNIKESGVEKQVFEKLNEQNITNFFLLDQEFPFTLLNFDEYGDYLSLRYSKYESIHSIKNFAGKVKWIWIDTYKDFELNEEIVEILKNFNLCLVSPSRWGFEDKQQYFFEKFKKYNLPLEAVMIDNVV